MLNQGTLVIAPIRPQSDQDTFPSAHSSEILGGHHSVANIAARNNIPDERRLEGMLCYTQDTMQTYQLVGGITNSDWCVFPLFRTDSISGQINGVQERDYILDVSAALNYKVMYITAFVSLGAASLNITTNISSAGGPNLTTNSVTYNYTTNNQVLINQSLKLTVSNISGAPDLFYTIGILVQNCGLPGN